MMSDFTPMASGSFGRIRAFSSEVETGSRLENATNQESRAPFRFYRNGKGSSAGLRAQTIIAAPIVVPEIIVPFVHDLMEIRQEMSK
jgi:hypothetical protein